MRESLLIGSTCSCWRCSSAIEVINRVPTTLHTPLMSGTNAIHGIVLVGAILVPAPTVDADHILGVIAVAFGAVNVVGGFWSPTACWRCSRRRPTPERKDERE